MAEVEEALTNRQRLAIVALLNHRTHEEAAAAVKVHVRTLYRWLGQDAFQRELVKARSRLIAGVLTDLAKASVAAAKVLHDIAANKRAPEAPRVSAAKAILDLTAKFEEAGVIEQRVAALEAVLAAQSTPNGGGRRWQ